MGIIPKRLHIRVEHARKSRSRLAFVERVKANDKLKVEAKKAGKKVVTKRIPVQPSSAHVVKGQRYLHEPNQVQRTLLRCLRVTQFIQMAYIDARLRHDVQP